MSAQQLHDEPRANGDKVALATIYHTLQAMHEASKVEWFTLDWNAQRLAVFDHDVDAIIRTHARDRKVAPWFEDTAEAFEEIGEVDLAID